MILFSIPAETNTFEVLYRTFLTNRIPSSPFIMQDLSMQANIPSLITLFLTEMTCN